MAKIDGSATNKIIMAAIFFLIGAVLIGVVVAQTNGPTNTVMYKSESVDFTTARNGCSGCANGKMGINSTFNYTLTYAPSKQERWAWKSTVSDCDIESVSVTNGTLTFTEGTDYVLTTNGKIAMRNSTNTFTSPINISYVTYTTCPDDYLQTGWSRSIINMIGGFMGIVLLGAAAGIVINLVRSQ